MTGLRLELLRVLLAPNSVDFHQVFFNEPDGKHITPRFTFLLYSLSALLKGGP